MMLIVVAHPNLLVVWNAKVNPRDRAPIAAFQFSEPLMRHVEISSERNSKDTAGESFCLSAKAIDSGTANVAHA